MAASLLLANWGGESGAQARDERGEPRRG